MNRCITTAPVTPQIVTPIPTPVPTRIVTPIPTPMIDPTRAIQRAVAEAIALLPPDQIESSAQQGTGGRVFTAISVYGNAYDAMFEEALMRSKRYFAAEGGDPGAYTDIYWRTRVKQEFENSARDGRAFFRSKISEKPVPTKRRRSLDEWKRTAPVFRTYRECSEDAQSETGETPDRYLHCVTEEDAIWQAVSHALMSKGIAIEPGLLQLTGSQYNEIATDAMDVATNIVNQRSYTPTVKGKRLPLLRRGG